jgi:hypothetical protein
MYLAGSTQYLPTSLLVMSEEKWHCEEVKGGAVGLVDLRSNNLLRYCRYSILFHTLWYNSQ